MTGSAMHSVLMVDDNVAMREALAPGAHTASVAAWSVRADRVGAAAGAAQLVDLHGNRAIRFEAALAGQAVASGRGGHAGCAEQSVELACRAGRECRSSLAARL